MSKWRWRPAGVAMVTAALVVSACGGDNGDADTQGQIVAVERGDIQISVTATGNISLPNQASLSFGSAGTVKRVAVEAGDRVAQGQVLAELDASALLLAVARAESNLVSARDALERLSSPAELAKQEEAVANARSQLQAAQDALEKAETPYSDQDLKKQDEAVANARSQLQAARDALDNARTPYSTAEIASAEAAVQRAQESLANNQAQLTVTENAQARLVAQASETVDSRERSYQQALVIGTATAAALDALLLARQNLDAARNQEAIALTAARRAITQAEDALRSAEESLQTRSAGADPLEVALKEAKLAAAEESLADTLTGADPVNVALKEAKLATGEANLAEAQDRLAERLAGPDPADVTLKAAKVVTAEANLAAAEQALADSQADDSPAMALKVARVATAQANLAEAEKAVAELNAGGDPVLLAQRTVQVLEAEQSVADAKEKLDKAQVKAPFAGVVAAVNVEEGDTVGANAPAVVVVDPTQVEVTAVVDEVDVISVRQGQEARLSLQSVPQLEFSGTVKFVSLLATRAQGIVSYPITVSFTLPQRGGGPPWGEGPQGGRAPQRGRAPQGVPRTQGAGLLREGLSVLLTIVQREEPDVLLVPVRAVSRSGSDRIVKVVREDGSTEDRAVQLGLSDGTNVQVLEGLEEGEQVLLAARGQTSQTGFIPGLGRGGGGGFGGGGQRGR